MSELVTTSDISAEVLQAKQRLGIVGNTPSLLLAIQRAVRVAPIDLSVLVTGESGSGKEFFPKIIHQYSSRKHSKYIAVNCGAIPEGTIDSELFGHEKGSFTGAVADRKGYFEEADGGTIFLDEVAELPLTTQARLLRVLETGEFLKVGSSKVLKTNIRVVAATNVDMAAAVAAGRFREDLYYRLSTVQIAVPPLRDRGNDIILLANRFAEAFAERYRMPRISFSDDARRLLLAYRWPGNVRQLKNVVEQIALFENGSVVDAKTLEKYLPADAPGADATAKAAPALRTHTYEREREMLFNLIFSLKTEVDKLRAEVDRLSAPAADSILHDHQPSTLPVKIDNSHNTLHANGADHIMDVDAVDDLSAAEPVPFAKSVEEAERETIRQALERNDGRRKETADELNISVRTLYRKIKDYGLE